ncbi:MAG: hypothetical protein J7496_15640 [Novosphingobium sp.]|nr:hypothetical protein [Novosphingobium sp.]MBO9603934.1 hypothetical protein [Novosphingobium sp.]
MADPPSSTPLQRDPARAIRALGFVLWLAGMAACFTPLLFGWWRLGPLGAIDAGLAIAVGGWLLLILAAVLRGRRRRRQRASGEAI